MRRPISITKVGEIFAGVSLALDPDKIKAFNQNKHRKNEYKKMLKEVDLQIKFLTKALKIKEIRNV